MNQLLAAEQRELEWVVALWFAEFADATRISMPEWKKRAYANDEVVMDRRQTCSLARSNCRISE